MKLSTETAAETLAGKPYTMEIEDEIDNLKSTIKALRRNATEDNCYILSLEEAIYDAKVAFHIGSSSSDMYNALTRTEVKPKKKVTSRWDHSTKPSKFIVCEDGKEVFRGNYSDGEKLINK
jgi:hypothetical protein